MTTICVYGNFEKKDIKVKVMTNDEQFVFQNILRKAGYDAELFSIKVEEDKRKEV